MQQRSFVGCGPGCACFVVATGMAQVNAAQTLEFISKEDGTMYARQRDGEMLLIPNAPFSITEDGKHLDFGPDEALVEISDETLRELELLFNPPPSFGERLQAGLHFVGAFLARGASFLPFRGRPALNQ